VEVTMARPSDDGLREGCPWCERELPARRTFAVKCAKCRQEKWPTLLQRPEPGTWVCALCIASGDSGRHQFTEAKRSALEKARAAQKASRTHLTPTRIAEDEPGKG
jgi:hypothetical protein